MLEQLVSTLPENVCIWVKERKPKTSTEAGQLADDYTQARKQNSKVTNVEVSKRPVDRPPQQYQLGGRQGHAPGPNAGNGEVEMKNNGNRRFNQPRQDLSNIECFNRHNKGYYSANCPHNSMFCRMPENDISATTVQGPKVLKLGKVEGIHVGDIVLDTGCSRTLVHRDLVPEENLLAGEAVAIRYAQDDTILYPLAQVQLEVEQQVVNTIAAEANRLSMIMLLGTDMSLLSKLLSGELQKTQLVNKIDNALVVTRARAKKELKDELELANAPVEAQPKPPETTLLENGPAPSEDKTHT